MKYFVLLLTIIVCLFSYSFAIASDNDKPLAVYQKYGDTWYEFRFDWRDSQCTPTDWQSVDELKAWLEYDNAPLILKADASGVVKFNGRCEDVAFQARDRAYEVGKRLDTEIITRQETIKYQQYLSGDVYKLGVNDGHYLNKAVVGNEVWFVQSDTDKIWLAYYLD